MQGSHGEIDPAAGSAEGRSTTELLGMLEERGARVERLDARLDLHLHRADGAEASLAGALSMERPGRFRLRSTKFGFLVCDVVIRDGGAWALGSPVVREQAESSAEATHALLAVLGSLLGWRSADAPPLTVTSEDGRRVVVSAPESTGARLEWTLDRADARVVEVRRLDGGTVVGVLQCSEHQWIDGVPVPRRLRFESATGTITVRVRSMRLGAPLPADAFTPPEGARPIE